MRVLTRHPAPLHALAIAPGGEVLSLGDDGVLRATPLEGGEGRVLARLDPGVRSLALAPDGRWAATGPSRTLAADVVRVDLASGEVRPIGGWSSLETAGGSDRHVTVSPDGEWVAFAFDNAVEMRRIDGEVVWQAKTYKLVYLAHFAPGGELLVGTWDGQVFLSDVRGWDGKTPAELFGSPVDYPGGPLFDAAFLPDGTVALAGADDDEGFLTRWRPPETRYLASLSCAHGLHAVAVSPDGRHLVGGGNDQALTLWSVPDLVEVGGFALSPPALEPPRPGSYFLDYYRTTGPDAVRAVVWHPDGERVLCGLESGALVEVTREELLARSGDFDLLALRRALKVIDAEVETHRHTVAILESGAGDPERALRDLEAVNPELRAEIERRIDEAIEAMLAGRKREREE